MRTSDSLDLEPGVFTQRSARAIAHSLKRSAERSTRRKSAPFRSAMSMLNFHINRAGKGLSATQRGVLERAKDALRKLYGKEPARAARGPRRTAKPAPPKPAGGGARGAGASKRRAARRPRPAP
jgi:hypothetical protein